MKAMTIDLERLRQIFDRHRADWLDQGHEGQWAIVTEDGAQGFYDLYEHAYLEAEAKLGGLPYLLQQVLREDRVEQIQLVTGL
jgi:hypothetical protein